MLGYRATGGFGFGAPASSGGGGGGNLTGTLTATYLPIATGATVLGDSPVFLNSGILNFGIHALLTVATGLLTLEADIASIGQITAITRVAGDTTVTNAHSTILIDTTGGPVNMTLPAITAANDGRVWVFKKISNDSDIVTLVGIVDDTTDFDLFQGYNQSYTIQADYNGGVSSQYRII